MRCPFCGNVESQVKDSRTTDDFSAIRRRRECPECGSRFTTFERIQLRELTVVKKNGEKRLFDRDKLVKSIKISVSKRPVNPEKVEKIADSIQRRLEALGEAEIQTSIIGDYVLDALSKLDDIAYIRFASVYKDFRDIHDFVEAIDKIGKRDD